MSRLSQCSYMGDVIECGAGAGVINDLEFLGKCLHWEEQDYKPFMEPNP